MRASEMRRQRSQRSPVKRFADAITGRQAHSPASRGGQQTVDSNSGGTHGTLGWGGTSLIIAGSMMGVGLLTVPAAFERLGWLPAYGCLYGFGTVACYTAVLYARLLAASPWTTSFYSLGRRALGAWGVALVLLTAYLSMFTAPLVQHLVCAQALQEVIGSVVEEGADVPALFITAFAVAAVAMPLIQIRKLRQVRWLGGLGSGAMTLSMCLLAWKLYAVEPSPRGGPHTRMLTHGSLVEGTVGVLNLMFVFTGQDLWVRYISAMHTRTDFQYAASAALSLVTPLTSLVGFIGYSTRGGSLSLDDPVTRNLRPDNWTLAINASLLLAVFIAYVLRLNVATQVLLEMWQPELFHPDPHGHLLGPGAGLPPSARLASKPSKELPSEREPLLAGMYPAEDVEAGEQLALPAPTSINPVADPIDMDGRRGAGAGAGAGVEPALPLSSATYEELPVDRSIRGGRAARSSLVEAAAEAAVAAAQDQQEQQRQCTPPLTFMVMPQRTDSEVGRALGTGIVFPAMVQQIAGSRGTSPPPPPPPGPEPPMPMAPGPLGTLPTSSHLVEVGTTGATPRRPSLHDGVQAAAGPLPGALALGIGKSSDQGAGSKAAGGNGAQGAGQLGGRAVQPAAVAERETSSSARTLWAVTSISLVLLNWMLARAVPLLSQAVSLITSVCGASTMLLLPCLFSLLLLRLPLHEKLLCGVLCAASLLITSLGVWAFAVDYSGPQW